MYNSYTCGSRGLILPVFNLAFFPRPPNCQIKNPAIFSIAIVYFHLHVMPCDSDHTFLGLYHLVPCSLPVSSLLVSSLPSREQKMFHGLMPVVSSFGLKMMKKMGWQEGTPLGRTGEGNTVPIALDVKMDRLGESGGREQTRWESDMSVPVFAACLGWNLYIFASSSRHRWLYILCATI